MKWDDVYKDHEMMIHSIVNQFFIPPGLERDDLMQVGLYGLWKAMNNYKPQMRNKFSTYAYVVIRNEILMLLRKHEKFQPEQDFLDFSAHGVSREDSDARFLMREMSKHLSQEDRLILYYLFLGYNQREIAKMLNYTQPTICKRVRKIKIDLTRNWGNLLEIP